MTSKMYYQNIPPNSLITQGFGTISYADTFETSCQTRNSIDSITATIFSVPRWINILMNSRNAIAHQLGLKTDIVMNKKIPQTYIAGERAVYFTVISKNDKEIIREEHDAHFRFRVSVMVQRKSSSIHLTIIVHYTRLIGKIFFCNKAISQNNCTMYSKESSKKHESANRSCTVKRHTPR